MYRLPNLPEGNNDPVEFLASNTLYVMTPLPGRAYIYSLDPLIAELQRLGIGSWVLLQRTNWCLGNRTTYFNAAGT